MTRSASAPKTAARRAFEVFARISAAAWVLFFGAGAAVALGAFDPGGLLLRLGRWGHGGQAYELMICVIYVVWGVYLWIAAGGPGEHRLFLDFTVVANAAHFLVMTVEGAAFHGEHLHLVGDVALGWAMLVPLAALWLAVRRQLPRETSR